MKKFFNCYIDGCNSCQREKACTQQLFGTLKPLPIPAGLWTNISYNMITDLPKSQGFDSILTMIDWLTKMTHLIPCAKNMTAEDLPQLMLWNVWQLHRTPKLIVSDQGSIFISQFTKELSMQLGIRLKLLTTYHPQTNGQSKIANKAVKQYLHHSVSCARKTGPILSQQLSLLTTTTTTQPLGYRRSGPTTGFTPPTVVSLPANSAYQQSKNTSTGCLRYRERSRNAWQRLKS
jgi:hypothetical protein